MAFYDVGDLLAKVPLDDLVSRLSLKVERRGHQVTAVCPFHQDTRPSLNLYAAARGMPAHFHCFACGAHGNAIDLVKEVNGIDFKASVEWLARQYNVQPVRGRPETTQRRGRRTSALDFALQQFELHHDAEEFERWSAERGFTAEFLYGKGLRCITGPVLVAAAEMREVGEALELLDGLLELGLVRRLRTPVGTHQLKLDYREQFDDYFADGRIVIPVYDAEKRSQRVVGFAGRLLNDVADSDVPKYRLTPGFKKADYLFNARAAFDGVTAQLKDNKPSRLCLVEGFFDALRLDYLGQHAVALMGTSLSKEQFGLLSGFIEARPDNAQPLSLCVFLDNDVAGFNATDRIVRELLGVAGLDLQWIGVHWRTRPGIGKDPDACLRDVSGEEHAEQWLQEYSLPAEAALLVASLGGKDSSVLEESWQSMPVEVKERALFRTALAIHRSRGRRQQSSFSLRLARVDSSWADDLGEVLKEGAQKHSRTSEMVYLNGDYERTALARTLAYFGSRRGELPCDEEAWLTLSANARLFDAVALDRLKSVIAEGGVWRQAAPFDAVNLPRKLSMEESVLSDPRRKVMPHPADLHVQQIFLNELLTERHDRISLDGRTFSASIPAVRWYSSRDEVVVSGPFSALNAPDLQSGEPATLSFGYQIDMEVLEGHRTPSDQGMFRPFGQCWHDFMNCLSKQCHAIGSQVHVLRLDVRRYYDTVQRFVVRDSLLSPLITELNESGLPKGLADVLGLRDNQGAKDWAESLERLLMGFLFGYNYRSPEQDGKDAWSEETIGIPQGPVISAYIGTIALFPLDNCARKFIRENGKVSDNGQYVPRAGYARYVDDIVIFADSAQLLGQLREALQAEARLSSVALIHKGDRVRAGSPEQVMRQLNEGRAFAGSVPGWEAPLVGDGEAGWGLAEDMPRVDRQCALRMLRHPDLIANPPSILPQVQAAMAAEDLRPNDLGLCTRLLWWWLAWKNEDLVDRASHEIWEEYWGLWEQACQGLTERWDKAFEQRGYHWLYAIEGLDRLLDPNPWIENGQAMEEVPKNRSRRQALAHAVCRRDFFSFLNEVAARENLSHLQRRTRLTASKARRLSRQVASEPMVIIHHIGAVTSLEWLCLAAEALHALPVSSDFAERQPLNELKNRESVRSQGNHGLSRADAVRDLLKKTEAAAELGIEHGEEEEDEAAARGMAIDFVLSSAPGPKGLKILATFKHLFKANDVECLKLIAHLPVAHEETPEETSLFAFANEVASQSKRMLVYTVPPKAQRSRDFIHVALGEADVAVAFSALEFRPEQSTAEYLGVEASAQVVSWKEIGPEEIASLGSRTRAAAALFDGLYAMHLAELTEDTVYVPFRPQLLQQTDNGVVLVHLVGEPIRREFLGVNAWFHDWDGRVRTTSVPKAHANLWRVGWTVADVLGIAGDMSGETGSREEMLPDDALEGETSVERRQGLRSELMEGYVLRQQLRKLQGAYLSEAQISPSGAGERALPGTVRRALDLLRDYPAEADVRIKTQHVLMMEAQTKAMALRLRSGAGADLRNVLHLVFPQTIGRLPLWLLQGIDLGQSGPTPQRMRPELSLMHALYGAMRDATGMSGAGPNADTAPPLRVALALAVSTAGLRGSVAALWGLYQDRHRLKDQLRLPAAWVPEELRANPQADYNAISKWLSNADWPALERASPWHWMLAMAGLLDASFPQGLDIPALADVFSVLRAWQYGDAAPTLGELTYEEAMWPFDDLPILSISDCDALVDAVNAATVDLDALLGLLVVRAEAPSFGRNRHTDEFTDAKQVGWQMSKPQYTALGGDDVQRVERGRRRLSSWTETRRKANEELVAVHWLGGKLGTWLGLEVDREMSNPVNPSNAAHGETAGVLQRPAPMQGAEDKCSTESEGVVLVAPNPSRATKRDDNVKDGVTESRWDDSGEAASEAGARLGTDFFAKLRELQNASLDIRKRGGGADMDGAAAKRGTHFRVALLQLSSKDTYCHPVAEVGIDGLPLSKHARDELALKLGNGTLNKARKAGQQGNEHQWNQHVDVISWPEHRRRAVLGEALNACYRLGVELLVLPEVSLRKETVQWMKTELTAHYPGLAVLAGTYRNFSSESHQDHLKEVLTLLWRPEKPLLDKFGLKEKATFELSRGKKYRAVAAHELFKPDLSQLAPLYSDESVFNAITQLRAKRHEDDSWSSEQVRGLTAALASGAPKLRHCMELICSELFLLTSPANRGPLVQELERILTLFGESNPSIQARTQVEEDLRAVGDLLTIAQTQRERRSVLLVPAHTTRSNDYWHAGQASVLASGTATVFCNAVLDGASGESCFIGIDSVTRSPSPGGVVKLLTPYHGWHTGILQPDGKGALSNKDEALVVVDMDPVHVVSGKPRPQLLPEPMTLVAYMPVVEVVDKVQNGRMLAEALVSIEKPQRQTTLEEAAWVAKNAQTLAELETLLTSKLFSSIGTPCTKEEFEQAYNRLKTAHSGMIDEAEHIETARSLSAFFPNPSAVYERFNAWHKDRHQQPGLKVGGSEGIEPAWLDFLVADLTCRGDIPALEVPSWAAPAPDD
ncbi:CHC2 zinc finger domain-containing protein [Stenotrophomonas sp. 22385]|uniref:CHC2 zinc finger domain-containing protein n=1 Tax=Stenotrophomonas sp. 22385 TaxID=3453915 RepID=UPI003F837632